MIDEYDIKDLRIVMMNKKYVEHHDDNLDNFNENIKFIVEKQVIQSENNDKNKYYAEYYAECITEKDLSFRVGYEEFENVPEIFSFVSRIPSKYFTKEEIKSGRTTKLRLYKIFQDINFTKENTEDKPKKLEKRKK